ncbi:MAG: YgjV family protein [Anaerolineae bacterium]|nr:YgjV family protein [Anaerolineae bacterium]
MNAELIGYIASALVIVSLVMTSVLRLRLISFVGAVAWFIYGVMLNAPPIYVTNGLIIVINVYFLFQMLRAKHYFKLLEVDRTSAYLRSFLEFYQKDIGKFFPSFKYDAEQVDLVFLVLRDLMPVGVFITERDRSGRALINLDYVIPGYRDLQPGKFLYEELDHMLPEKGVRTLYSVPGSEKHHAYLERMGFAPVPEATSGGLYQREIG